MSTQKKLPNLKFSVRLAEATAPLFPRTYLNAGERQEPLIVASNGSRYTKIVINAVCQAEKLGQLLPPIYEGKPLKVSPWGLFAPKLLENPNMVRLSFLLTHVKKGERLETTKAHYGNSDLVVFNHLQLYPEDSLKNKEFNEARQYLAAHAETVSESSKEGLRLFSLSSMDLIEERVMELIPALPLVRQPLIASERSYHHGFIPETPKSVEPVGEEESGISGTGLKNPEPASPVNKEVLPSGKASPKDGLRLLSLSSMNLTEERVMELLPALPLVSLPLTAFDQSYQHGFIPETPKSVEPVGEEKSGISGKGLKAPEPGTQEEAGISGTGLKNPEPASPANEEKPEPRE